MFLSVSTQYVASSEIIDKKKKSIIYLGFDTLSYIKFCLAEFLVLSEQTKFCLSEMLALSEQT